MGDAPTVQSTRSVFAPSLTAFHTDATESAPRVSPFSIGVVVEGSWRAQEEHHRVAG